MGVIWRMLKLLKVLVKRIKEAGAYKEKDTERDGFLSYAAETHSVGHGLYDGLTTARPTANELPENDDVQAEPHYYKGAFVLGTLIQVAIVGGIGVQFL